jgi:superfamily II DNA or RNA helicase
MTAIFAAIGGSATPEEIKRVLYLTSRVTPESSRLPATSLQKLLERMGREGMLVCEDGKWRGTAGTPAERRGILSDKRWATIPDAVSRAIPAVNNQGVADLDLISRDLRNALYVHDVTLVNSAINVLRDNLHGEYLDGAIFDCLYDPKDCAWLLELPAPLLAVCAWQLIPIAIRRMAPITPLAEKLLANQADFPAIATFPLVDYELLCGHWSNAISLLKAMPHTPARELRQGWLACMAGQNDKSLNFFIDALYESRQKDNHEFYFQTVGGIFFILAQVRLSSENSLSSAAANAELGMRLPEWHEVYEALSLVISSRHYKEFSTSDIPTPSLSRPLNAFFIILAEYWINNQLSDKSLTMLRKLSGLASKCGFTWLQQEIDELQERCQSGNISRDRHFHVLEYKNVPFIIDCIPVRNGWMTRLNGINDFLSSLADKPVRRLVWHIINDENKGGLLTARPVEQHLIRNGKWSKGRKFTAYRCQDYCNGEEPPDLYAQNYRLSPHDKYSCTVLKQVQEKLEQQAISERTAWGIVFQALVGHPLLFLDTPVPRPITCRAASPYVRLLNAGNCYEFQLWPQPAEGENIIVQSDETGNIEVFTFEQEHIQLRKLLGQDFRIPKDSPDELTRFLQQLCRKYNLLSDCIIQEIEIPAEETSSKPFIKLTPEGQTLRVNFHVQPFPDSHSSYLPGTGPREIFLNDNGNLHRYVRNFDKETERCEALVAACPALLNSTSTEKWDWLLNSPYDCYELMQQLHEHLDDATILWPEDKSFHTGRLIGTSSLSLHTQNYKDWFCISGSVKIDEDLTVSLQELLQKVSEHDGRFVMLDSGQVIALSDSFRKKLDDLNRFGEFTQNNTFQVSKYLVPLLSDFLADVGKRDDDPQWEATRQKLEKGLSLKPNIPIGLNAELRPYQKEGFIWLSRLDAIQAGACLADDMGLGKTIQAISLILSKASEGPALVVTPTSVCSSWLTEFQRFAPSLKVTFFGPGDRQETLKAMGPGCVLICSYGLLQSESSAFENKEWRIAVLDEAQAIKNHHAKRSQAALHIHAKFKLVTTGTPVENNLNELWAIFRFILPGLLGDRDHFQKRFANQIERKEDADQDALKRLNSVIHPFLLRRLKSQVLQDLPPKTDITFPVTISDQERAFYEALRRQILERIEHRTNGNDGQIRIEILSGLTTLRRVLCHPSLIPGGEGIKGTKLEAFLELLDNIIANGHKTLVFSQFTSYLAIVRDALDAKGIRYEYLDGTMNTRERRTAVSNFQRDNSDCPVFLISLKAGGLGLNLTKADYVIHLDPWWNPAVENQASDRAYRIGQKRPVTVYHLIATDTIEDNIRKLHVWKRDLADQLLAGNDKAEQTSLETLMKILKE